MTVAKLVIEIEARNRALRAVFADSSRQVNALVREVEKANQTISKIQASSTAFGDNSAKLNAQKAAARALSEEIVSGYRTQQKALKDLLSAGAISKEDFVKRGSDLASATIAGARSKIETSRGILGDSIANSLIQGFEQGGTKGVAAFEKGARNVKMADRFLNELNAKTSQSLAKIDEKIGLGILSSAERANARGQVIANRNEQLINQINQMESKGQMRPSLKEAMLTQLDPKGFGVGISRTAAERAFADAERQIGLLQQKFQQSIGRTKIDLAAGLDPREAQKRVASAFEAMNQGIIHGRERLRAAGSLTPEIESLLAKNIVKVPKVDPDITQIQRTFSDVTRQVGRLEDRLQTEVARTKLDIAGGLDARAGEKRIAAAYENMNRGIVHGRERLAQANLLTPDIEKFLSSSLVKVPKTTPDLTQVERTFQDVTRQIGKLQQRMQTDVGRAKLDLAAGLDPRIAERRIAAAFESMNKGIEHGRQRLAQAGNLTPEIERLLAKSLVKVPKVTPDLTDIERTFQDTQRQVGRLQQKMQTEVARTKLDLAAGLDPKVGEQRIAAAFDAMNRGIQHGRQRLAQANKLTPEIEQLLAKQLQSAQSTVTRATRSIGGPQGASAATDFIKQFAATYNSKIGEARAALEKGDISRTAFKRLGRVAAEDFNSSLSELRTTLKAANLLPPNVEAEILKQYKNTGKKAGLSFMEAMQDPEVVGKLQLGGVLTRAGTVLAATITAPLAAVAAASAKLAGDAEQSAKRLEISFGPASVQLQRNLNALREEIPATSSELNQMASRLGELIIPIGLSSDKVAEMSTNLIKVTKNISLFSGVSSERAFNAVINGLVGQSRELKKLGIDVDDATIRDRAYREGIARVGAQLSTLQKVQAGYIVIMERTRLIEGTLVQSQDTFNVKMLFFTARVKEAGIAIGSILLPFLTRFFAGLTGIAERIAAMSEAQRQWVIGLAIAAATIGPLLIALGSLTKALAIYRAAALAASLATSLGGAGAAAGGALGLGSLLVAGGPIVAVLGLITAAVIAYAIATSGASDQTARFQREISGMSKASIQASQITLREAIRHNEELLRAYQKIGIRQVTDPLNKVQAAGKIPPTIVGGTPEERAEFSRIRKETAEWNEQLKATVTELDKITQAEAQAAKFAEAYKDKIDAIMQDTKNGLLTEQLRAAQNELRNLNAAGAEASKAFTVGRRTQDIDLMNRGLEKAKETLSSVTILLKSFTEARNDPGNARITKELDRQISLANKLAISMQGIINTAEKTESLKEFGEKLSEIRKQLALSTKTEDLAGRQEAFTELANLQGKVQKALTDVVASGDTLLQGRFRAVLADIELLRIQFRNLVPLELFQQIDAITAKLKVMQDSTGQGPILSTGIPLENFDAAKQKLKELNDLNFQLSEKILLQKLRGEDVTKSLEKQAQVQKTINQFTPNVFEEMFGKDFLPRLAEISAAVNTAQAQMQNAQLFGDSAAAEKAHLDMVRALSDLGKLREALIAAMTARGISPQVQATVLQGFADAYRKASGAAGDFADKVDKGSRRLIRMGQLVAVIRQIAEAFGLTGGNIDKAISSLGTLLTSIEQLRKANADFETRRKEEAAKKGVDPSTIGRNFEETLAQVSSVVGIVVSAFNTVRSIVDAFKGKSQSETEHDEIIKKNSDHLEELSSALNNFTLSIGNQLRVQRAISDPRVLAQLNTAGARQSLENVGLQNSQGTVIERINRILGSFGITLADVQRIAKENGIQILDSKGRLVAGAFEQLAKAIGINVQLLVRYNETLEDQITAQQLRNNVFDVPQTPDQIIQDQAALLQRLAPELFKKFFAGIDITDATQVKAAVKAMTIALLSGAIDFTKFGNLFKREDLEKIITGFEEGLDKMTEAANDAAESLLNIPQGFKLALARFNATLPDFNPPSATPPKGIPPTPNPTPIPSEPPVTVATVGGDITIGTIIFQPTATGQSIEQQTDEFLSVLRRRRFNRTGSNILPGIDD